MSELSEQDRRAIDEAAERIAAEMPEWTDEQLDELRRIAESAPRREQTHGSTQRSA